MRVQYIVRRFDRKVQKRQIWQKSEEWQGLSLTSLVDILTILLVYLIKNVTIEVQKLTMPANMEYPTTMTPGDPLGNKATTLLQIYRDRILVGDSGVEFGALDEIRTNQDKRVKIRELLQSTVRQIKETESAGASFQTALLIQADKNIPCWYITEVVLLGKASHYEYIYFATLQEEEWLNRTNPATGLL